MTDTWTGRAVRNLDYIQESYSETPDSKEDIIRLATFLPNLQCLKLSNDTAAAIFSPLGPHASPLDLSPQLVDLWPNLQRIAFHSFAVSDPAPNAFQTLPRAAATMCFLQELAIHSWSAEQLHSLRTHWTHAKMFRGSWTGLRSLEIVNLPSVADELVLFLLFNEQLERFVDRVAPQLHQLTQRRLSIFQNNSSPAPGSHFFPFLAKNLPATLRQLRFSMTPDASGDPAISQHLLTVRFFHDTDLLADKTPKSCPNLELLDVNTRSIDPTFWQHIRSLGYEQALALQHLTIRGDLGALLERPIVRWNSESLIRCAAQAYTLYPDLDLQILDASLRHCRPRFYYEFQRPAPLLVEDASEESAAETD